MTEGVKKYIEEYRTLEIESRGIPALLAYVRREIKLHQLHTLFDIRNTDDAIRTIETYQKHVDKVSEQRKVLIEKGHNIPPFGDDIVIIKSGVYFLRKLAPVY
ncbi:MAG: hypothetical protein LIP01_15720, partial [Tannerellaceae bacterium]|nr:hypothetical protein [Tannerellaceae bacterium]